MNLNNFKSVYSEANILYGTTIDSTNFEDIALNGWQLIGNKQTRLYKYTTNTENKTIKLPCNVDELEAVTVMPTDANTSSNLSSYPNTSNQWIEDYIDSWNINKNSFHIKGSLVKYQLVGDSLIFEKDYSNVTILYKGILVDEEGLPYLSDKEVQALAAYCAYSDLYKKSLIQRDGNLLQLAGVVKNDWLRLCNSARVPNNITQNEMNDVLDVITRWDRKIYNKSFKPIL